MSEQKKTQGPLLYIYQPFSRTPVNQNMQDVFVNKRKVQEPIREPVVEEIIEIEVENRMDSPSISIVNKELESKLIQEKDVPEKKAAPSFNKVKPFKEMGLIERLEYLNNFPKVLPPVSCIFYTIKGNFQGILSNYENDQLTIRLPNQTTKLIPLAELTNVVMMGLKQS